MPLAITAPFASGTVDTILVRMLQWDIENHTIGIVYDRYGGGNLIDRQTTIITEAAYAAAVGVTAKLKVYAALQTAIGAPGTVS